MHDHNKVLRVFAATLLAVAIDASLTAQVPLPWTEVNLMPSEREAHAMAYDSQRNVTLVFGGRGLLPLGCAPCCGGRHTARRCG